MADSKKKKLSERERVGNQNEKVKKERGKGKCCEKLETAAKIGHLLRLEHRIRQTAQKDEKTALRRVAGTGQ